MSLFHLQERGGTRLMKIPKHVAIILDGKWKTGQKQGYATQLHGHTVGAKNVETVCQAQMSLELST